MNICLYGASSPEIDPVYLDAAYAFGRLLAQHGHTLVYGGGAQGVMGAAARGAYEAGGKITGIAPTFLQVDGILFDHCTEFLLTDTMAERKTAMIAHADAFVMAPGGFGTLEEFFEVLTLKQLGGTIRPSPCSIPAASMTACRASSAPRWSGASSARPACRSTRCCRRRRKRWPILSSTTRQRLMSAI